MFRVILHRRSSNDPSGGNRKLETAPPPAEVACLAYHMLHFNVDAETRTTSGSGIQSVSALCYSVAHQRGFTHVQSRAGHATVTLGVTKDIALRLVDRGRFESVSEACREGLRRLDAEQSIVDRLVALGEEGMASGIAEGFDIDRFVEDMRVDPDPAS